MMSTSPSCYSHDQTAFLKKGHHLSKKSCQVKISQVYLRDKPIFLRGRTPLSIPFGDTFVVPSDRCLLHHDINYLIGLRDAIFMEQSKGLSIMFLQSVIRNFLESSSSQSQKKLKLFLFENLLLCPQILFNENLQCLASQQSIDRHENLDAYRCRLFAITCLRLAAGEILGKRSKVIVLVSGHDDPVHQLLSEEPMISMLPFTAFLEQYFGKSSSLDYENLINQKAEETTSIQQYSNGGRLYLPHEPPSNLKDDLSKGLAFRGTLSVYKHNPFEAQVEVIGSDPTLPASQNTTDKFCILIKGRLDMNRAVDGDEVCVRLHERGLRQRATASTLLTSSAPSDSPDMDGDAPSAIFDDKDFQLDAVSSSGVTSTDELSVFSADAMPMGRVVAILRPKRSEVVAMLPIKQEEAAGVAASGASTSSDSSRLSNSLSSFVTEREEHVLAIPCDHRLPKVRVRTRQWARLQGQKVIVVIDEWPADSMFPNGHMVRTLGDPNDWRTEVQALMIQNSVFPQPFSAMALACLPVIMGPASVELKATESDKTITGDEKQVAATKHKWVDSGWQIAPHQLNKRLDLRQTRCVFSVDPPGCQDIDDAMSAQWKGPGLVEVPKLNSFPN